MNAVTTLGSQPTFLGYIQFVLHHFNFRHVNAIDYLTIYSKGSAWKIDLVTPSLVDYDWWLARGKATATSLADQVDVMSQVSVLMGGRVHGFVSFCPPREVISRDRSGVGDSMRMVKRAIETSGFIGVKLYPPMGFAPWGNAGKTIWQGKPSLPAPAADPDFGEQLDTARLSRDVWRTRLCTPSFLAAAPYWPPRRSRRSKRPSGPTWVCQRPFGSIASGSSVR